MKKFLIFTAILWAMAFFVSSAEAKTTAASASAESQMQVRYNQPRRWNNRRVRTVITTRITRIGRYRYRETYRVTYLPNGRTRTRLLSRVRIGRNW